jgi:hypothetical protein
VTKHSAAWNVVTNRFWWMMQRLYQQILMDKQMETAHRPYCDQGMVFQCMYCFHLGSSRKIHGHIWYKNICVLFVHIATSF